jgi:hypothetical protein
MFKKKKKLMTTVRITVDTHQVLQVFAYSSDMDMTEAVEFLLKDAIMRQYKFNKQDKVEL